MADTDATRERGLMFRKVQPRTEMLFDFKHAMPVAFWMKNTLFPSTCCSSPLTTASPLHRPRRRADVRNAADFRPVLGVLEIPAAAQRVGAKPGDRVKDKIFHP